MKKFFTIVFASLLGTIMASVIILFFMLIIFFSAVAVSSSSGKTHSIKEHTILAMQLKNKIVDNKSSNPFDYNMLTNMDVKEESLTDILNNIKKAKTDKNIDGIFLRLSSIKAGMATVEEIRKALLDFKESGKFIVTHANYYGHKSYYLASVADKVYMTPEGGMSFVGLSAQIMFYKNMFEKLDIKPVIIRHGKFKSAVEPFMLDKMSEANKEQTSSYINSMWNDIITKIGKARNISTDELNRIANDLLITNSESCVKLNLVDSLMYYDELLENLRKRTEAEATKDIEFVSNSQYKNVPDKEVSSEDKIAIVYASGEIVDGEGNGSNIGGSSLSRTIRKIRQDDKIKAIVLRVNSPGGSAMASEIIWREVSLAKKEKPVIVSMGDYAASGGYYISCSADTIIADANTLTGSIGVFGLMFNIKNFMNNKLGINVDGIKTNEHSDLGSAMHDMSAEERAYIQTGVETVYSTFTNRVAKGRNMSVESVDSIGQGRVWSGVQAKELGLVDMIGGLDTAITIAADKAQLKEYKIVKYPKAKEPIDAIMEALNEAKIKSIEHELGGMSRYYKMFKNMSKRKGVQARMPMEIYID